MAAHAIKYLQHHQLDKSRWDACIGNARNGLVYAYSFYLDHMAGKWDALVLNDYEAVMPLPFRRKWGIYYLYQPALTAQLGVFGKQVTPEILYGFLSAVPAKFRYWHLSFNHQNCFGSDMFPLKERMNYVLDLSSTYSDIYAAYRDNIKRNIRKHKTHGSSVIKDFAVEKVLALTKFQSEELPPIDQQNFTRLYYFMQQSGNAITYGISNTNGELMASAVFFFSNHRAYYILVGNHPNGRTMGASHALIDAFIQDYAGRQMLLDFEGSDLHNLAFFYSSYGAKAEKYPAIIRNNLPWFIRWMK